MFSDYYGEDMDRRDIRELEHELQSRREAQEAIHDPHLDDPQVQAEMRACGY